MTSAMKWVKGIFNKYVSRMLIFMILHDFLQSICSGSFNALKRYKISDFSWFQGTPLSDCFRYISMHSCEDLMVIMRQTAPKRFPLRKCAKRVSPWKNFEILVHVFSSDFHKKHTYYEGISKTIMMQYVLCIIKV